mmetsp:Transcript_23960/g.42882  ORF Transcript_23960/g.42882 Transcript_23960/m.42882 type:complete len:262 (+) Transcript_23960:662-1447(+)
MDHIVAGFRILPILFAFFLVVLFFQQRYFSLIFLFLPHNRPSQLHFHLDITTPLRPILTNLTRLSFHNTPRPIQRLRRLHPQRLPPYNRQPFLPLIRLGLSLQRLLPCQQCRITLDVRDIPPPFRLLHDAYCLLTQILHKVRQRRPFRRVHMNMMLILDNLLIHMIGIHPLRAMPPPQSLQISHLELLAEGIHHAARVLAEDFHLAEVRVGRHVAFEAVLVAALLGAHLAVEFEFLEALGFGAVGDILGGSFFGFGHDAWK